MNCLFIIGYFLIGMIMIGFEQYSDIKDNSIYARPSERNVFYIVGLICWPILFMLHFFRIAEFIIGIILYLISFPFYILISIPRFVVTQYIM